MLRKFLAFFLVLAPVLPLSAVHAADTFSAPPSLQQKLARAGFFSIRTAAFWRTDGLESAWKRARSFRYSPDPAGDLWQKPEETELRRSGDCEDKALWLYAALKKAGYRPVRLVVGKFRAGEPGHHVWVEYGDKQNPLILDPATQRRPWRRSDFRTGSYVPLASFATP